MPDVTTCLNDLRCGSHPYCGKLSQGECHIVRSDGKRNFSFVILNVCEWVKLQETVALKEVESGILDGSSELQKWTDESDEHVFQTMLRDMRRYLRRQTISSRIFVILIVNQQAHFPY